ncbi:MAG: sugar phosphate isomerase/epimerase [Cyclobacteriaceae bacterium]|nr:sugar phosphate isomerase/epimerase [Cyclobacteriaceae bacterium]
MDNTFRLPVIRHNLLAGIILATALMSVLPSMVTAQDTGLQLYSLREQFKENVPGTLALIRSWGITYIEGGDTYGMEQGAFIQLLQQNGLKTASIGADFNELQQDPMAIVQKAKAYGASYVVCFWIPHQGNEFGIENLREAIRVFEEAGKILHENNLSLCYHPHGYEFRPYKNGTLFDYMVQKLDERYVNFELDVFWAKQGGEDPLALLQKYPSRFLLMHLKDRQPGTEGNKNGQADVETNIVLGTGDVGIENLVNEARRIGMKYLFIEDESSRSPIQIPLSLDYLKTLN